MLKHIKQVVNVIPNVSANVSVSRPVNRFLAAVGSNNMANQRKLLQKVYTSSPPVSVKINCLNIMLDNYLKFPPFINLYDVMAVYDDFDVARCYDDVTRDRFVNCLEWAVKNTKPGDRWRALSYRKRVLEEIGEGQGQDQIITGDKHPGPDLRPETGSIEPYKINGILTPDSLLQFIKTSLPHSKSITEYYDSLSPLDQAKFSDQYHETSTAKQLQIEENMANISVNIKDDTIIKALGKTARAEIDQWFTFAPLEPETKHYTGLLKLIDSNKLTNMLLSQAILSCIKHENERPMVELIFDLIYRFKLLAYSEARFKVTDDPDHLIGLMSSLLNLLINHCKVNVETLADPDFGNNLFIKSMKYRNNKSISVLKLNPLVYDRLVYSPEFLEAGELFLPMLCPPAPWTSPTTGGYLNSLKPVLSSKSESTYINYLQEFNKHGQLNFIYKNLNYMGSIPWCVNPFMAQVIQDIFSSQVPDVIKSNLDLPPLVSDLKKSDHSLREWPKVKTRALFFNSTRKLARAFRDNIFYFPHHLDFRGRVYPQAGVFTYHQEDSVRSLLQFWTPLALGPNGLNWLKYQLASLYGQDKLSAEDRIKFVDKNYTKIMASAKDPFIETWWSQSDKPWQVLSLCHELYQISLFQGPVETYKTRIPIHQDGSCNGLQHYAALTKDPKGAKTVNLLPSVEKQDVYTEVLNLMKQKLTDTKEHQIIDKIVTRKLIKRPIMTQVYGVTRYGSLNQISEELKHHKLHHLSEEEYLYYTENQMAIVNEITGLIFESIDHLFVNSKAIQKWLTQSCFKVISSISEEQDDFLNLNSTKPMMWTSPSGFPIIQMYYETYSKGIRTTLQHFSVKRPVQKKNQLVINKRKQLNAVAPNYIHSLDSVHLLMTCAQCEQQKVPFVAVHDSFWTTPRDADKLGDILRREFVSMYSQNPLQHLYEDMSMTLKDCYHVLWFDHTIHKNLGAEIQLVRGTYTSAINTKSAINTCLNREIHDSKALDHINSLIQSHKPKLYFKRNRDLYSADDLDGPLERFLVRRYTPVLVRATVLEPPPTGDLDLAQVLDSKYFFS